MAFAVLSATIFWVLTDDDKIFFVSSSSLRSVLVALPGSQISFMEVSVLCESLLDAVCLLENEEILTCDWCDCNRLKCKDDAVNTDLLGAFVLHKEGALVFDLGVVVKEPNRLVLEGSNSLEIVGR